MYIYYDAKPLQLTSVHCRLVARDQGDFTAFCEILDLTSLIFRTTNNRGIIIKLYV